MPPKNSIWKIWFNHEKLNVRNASNWKMFRWRLCEIERASSHFSPSATGPSPFQYKYATAQMCDFCQLCLFVNGKTNQIKIQTSPLLRLEGFTYSECNIVLNIKFWKWKKWFHLFKCVQCRRGAYASALNADKFKCFVYRESTMKIENWHRIDRVNSQWHFGSHTTHNICLNKLIRTDFLFPRCGARSVCLTGNPRFIITVGTLFPRTKHTSSIAEKYVANGSSFTTHTQIDPITDDWLKVQPMRLPFHVLYHHEMATTSSASKWPSLLMNIEKHRHFSLETRAPVKEHVIISPAASFSTTLSKCSLTLAPEKESTSAKNSLCLKIETIFSPHYFPTIFFSSNQVSVCISVYAGSIPFFFQNIQPCIDREYDLNFN